MGAIAFSCVESLWKGIVGFINEKCRNKNCKEKCNYFKFDTLEKLNNAKPFEIMKHLSAMRIFYLHTSEEDKITELQSLRNHIHLTRILLDGDCSQSFDINFVENISRIFYVTLNQIELFNHFFDEDNFCIKELDDDGYEQTKELSVKERNFYHTQKIVLAAINLFHNALLKT